MDPLIKSQRLKSLERVKTSNKIIQKGLAFLSKQSATLASSERKSSSGILPRRLDGRGGASVVRRRDATEPKEILMSKQKSKRQTPLRSNGRTAGGRTSLAYTARKATKLKGSARPVVGQQQRCLGKQPGHADTKQARIIAMLRTAGGATIEAMTRATGWQQHSVRGFLAAVVRKKLGLNLVSTAAEGGRVYRIADGTDAHVAAKAAHAA